MNNRLIVKIGTESLAHFHSSEKITKLVDGIRTYFASTNILLVTSGAVQFGREASGVEKYQDENKQVLAARGWHRLISAYEDRFRRVHIPVAGYLVTHADIEDNISRADTFKRTIEATWEDGVLPVVNENDPISTEEMQALGRGADNDKNALLLAKLFRATSMVIITNTNGVYQDPKNPGSRIARLGSNILTPTYINALCNGISTSGTGGMASKLEIAHEAGKYGITTHIGNGVDSGIHDQKIAGTTIFPG